MLNERPPDPGPARSLPGQAHAPTPSDPPANGPRRWTTRLLRVPLFYKILLANAGAVALAAGVGAWLAATHAPGGTGGAGILAAALLIAAAAGLASAGVHVFLLRRALAPLRELARVATRLREEGPESELRARIPSTADRNLADLIRVFTSGRPRDGLGLLAMRERARHAGGRLGVTSRPGEGTTVHVVLPLLGTSRSSGPGRSRPPTQPAARGPTTP